MHHVKRRMRLIHFLANLDANNCLAHAERRLFGNASLKRVSSVHIELKSFQFNHEQQLKQQRPLSLLFLSEHISLLGSAVHCALLLTQVSWRP